MPRHLRGTTLKIFLINSCAGWLPSRRTARAYWFSTSARPDSSCCTVISTPCKMSSGSKPVTTIGTRYFAASGKYSSNPITVQTWPAARNPCTLQFGDDINASMAGGTSTCEMSIEKFSNFFCAAW